MDHWKLAGKVAFVTGASGGLGAHFAKTLSSFGADVVIGARRPDAMAQIAQAIVASGGKCRMVPLDVADPASIAALDALLPQIDILVNNAGIVRDGAALDQTVADWDAVIDAEASRRRYLEAYPEPSTFEDEVKFDTSMVPWWVWVRRFHLPEAEKVNGRAAMIGFATGYLVDAAAHAGLVSQTDSFLGKTFMYATFLGCALIRSTKDLETFKGLAKEATFYDDQWNATWKGVERPSEKDN